MESVKVKPSILDRIDVYSILRDVLRNLWAILLGAAAIALIINMVIHARVENTYSTKATFVVTSKTSGNYAYNNLSAASTMANSFSNILNSNLLKKKVCSDLQVSSFNAVMNANVVKDTNLMVLRVTSDTPWNTYRITRSVMKNMSELTKHVSTDMVLEVLQSPAVPTGADNIGSTRNQMIKGGLLGAVGFAALFMVLSFLKDTIKSEKDLEDKLDARSVGVLYYYKNRFKELFKRKKSKLLVSEVTAGFEFVERFKKIAAQIVTKAQNDDAKVILITSVREHEGKSTVSANIALSLARQSDSVLLIDGDLRRPSLAKLFLNEGEKPGKNFARLISGEIDLEDAVIFDVKRNLHILLNGKNYSNSTDIVSSDTISYLIEQARRQYDYVIIDTPPMSLMADAEVMADLSDMSILVVRYDLVQAQDLNDAIDALRVCKADFYGCVLNQVRTMPGQRRTVVGYGGYGRYGKYGRYGRYGKYGKYGRYGNYGNYGAYGYYGHYSNEDEESSGETK